MTYRIFTNDRKPHTIKGFLMYSAFKEVEASSREEALLQCPPQFTYPYYAPAAAIRWPEEFQSNDEKLWLRNHVYA